MIKPSERNRARALLEQQLQELGKLRNASQRAQEFKAWRQHTVTVLQMLWPDEPRRADRFRRIPFSPPQTRPDARAVREHYERGCAEAGELLRAYAAEVPSSTEAAPPPAPAPVPASKIGHVLSAKAAAARQAPGVRPAEPDEEPAAQASPEPPAESRAILPLPLEHVIEPAESPGHEDEIQRTTADFLSASPVFARRRETRRSVVARAFLELAEELPQLDLTPPQRAHAHRLLHELADGADEGGPSWEKVQEAIRMAAISPALARRALPLLLPFASAAA